MFTACSAGVGENEVIQAKIGKCPEIVFTELDDDLNGQAFPDHIVLNSSRLESPGRELFLYSPAQSS